MMDSAEEIGARAVHQAFVLHSDSEAEVFALSEMASACASCGWVFASCLWGLGRPELASGHGAFSAPSAGFVKNE